MLLDVKDLRVDFKVGAGHTEVIHGIDIAVDENEVVGLVGESGCGKTVSAFAIMGILPPNGKIKNGSVMFEGKNILNLKDSEMRNIRGRNIAMIFQEPFTSLNPVMRVGEQIQEAVLAHKKVSKDQAKRLAFDLLTNVQIENPERIYYGYPHQLSGGQRQRVLIATALVLGPKLLIADEPTTALDVTTQHEILKLLIDLKKNMKMSVLFITHDFGIINEIADRVCVMKDGQIVERGAKKDILTAPRHPYTCRLLEAVPKIAGAEKRKTEYATARIWLEAKSLSKSFVIERGVLKKESGRVDAVRDVDLAIREGATMGLVGESGSGKTTLARLLLGLLTPDKGEIYIKGKNLKRHFKETPYEIRQMMQIVFQDPYGSLDPRMTMGDIVLEGPTILQKSKSEKEAILKDVLAKARLDIGGRFKYPHQFSGGQRQRIAIARALATNAQFLILDEPVSSLDVIIQKEILDLLRLLQREMNLTYLFISHDLRVVQSMSDEIAVMYQGSIVEIGPCREVSAFPKHPYTKRLLESIPALA